MGSPLCNKCHHLASFSSLTYTDCLCWLLHNNIFSFLKWLYLGIDSLTLTDQLPLILGGYQIGSNTGRIFRRPFLFQSLAWVTITA